MFTAAYKKYIYNETITSSENFFENNDKIINGTSLSNYLHNGKLFPLDCDHMRVVFPTQNQEKRKDEIRYKCQMRKEKVVFLYRCVYCGKIQVL